MYRLIICLAVTVAVAGCTDRGHAKTHGAAAAATETAELSQETFTLGSDVLANGAIPREAAAEAIHRGGEMFLSVNVGSASAEQTIEVRWLDGGGRVIKEDRRTVPEGSRYVAFSSGPTRQWQNGTHRAVVVIDGRRVSEKVFAVL